MGGIPASLVRVPKARAVTGAPGFQRFSCHCLEWPVAKHLLMLGPIARCVSEPAGGGVGGTDRVADPQNIDLHGLTNP